MLSAQVLNAQFWYLDIFSGKLAYSQEGGEHFIDKGLLFVGKGNAKELAEQLPHALDGYGIDYDYQDDGIMVYTSKIYKTWRLMKAGEDIQMTLNVLILADFLANIQGTQTRIVGNLFRNGFPKVSINNASHIWELPAVQRGVEIEVIRTGSYRLPHGFPVVDMLKNGIATSIKSIDISLPSYRGAKLLYKLKGYVNKLIDFQGTSWGGRTVLSNTKKALEIVVPKGKVTAAQQKIFIEVVEYGKMNNISVKFIKL